VSEYDSIAGAARRLRIGRDKIRGYIRAGRVQLYQFGGTKRVKLAELERAGREGTAPKAVDVREIARRSLR
jgi:excisionase family DNA binding protein